MSQAYEIRSIQGDTAEYTPRGACEEFLYCHDPEVILAGPAETGKTLAMCWKIHTFSCKYPGSQIALLRKVAADIPGTVLQTLTEKVYDEFAPLIAWGGEHPEHIQYDNGSRIWLGGMDKPGKALSAERDLIATNQTEEFEEQDWETLTTRCTGRAGHSPYSQIIGDCNPGPPSHFILKRAREGKLTLFHSKHTDNPTLYDSRGQLTPRGVRTMATLEALTGIRRERLYLGKWVSAEGAVYEFERRFHRRERPDSEMIAWAFSIDEGYTNPAVILIIGMDRDYRFHIRQEFYKTQQLQSTVVQVVREWYEEFHPSIITVDSAAAGLIAELASFNLPVIGSKGRIQDGIAWIQDLLKVQGDGRPRLTVDPECENTINEFESYSMKPDSDIPLKVLDHAMDAIRYFFNHLFKPAELESYSYEQVQIGDW